MENFVWPIITNILSPLILFLVGGLFLKVNWVSKFVSKIYKNVYDGLRLNSDDVASGESIDEISEEKTYLPYFTDFQAEKNAIQKTSKNYGRDEGWNIRTFYTIAKQKILDVDMINFKESVKYLV